MDIFTALPKELQLLIFSYVAEDRTNLRNVAVLSKKLQHVAEELLYRSISLEIGTLGTETRKYDRLTTALQSRKLRCTYIRSVHLTWLNNKWLYTHGDKPPTVSVHDLTANLLSRLPNLRVLHITDNIGFSREFELSFFPSHPHIPIQELHFHSCTMSQFELYLFLKLHTLRTLSVSKIEHNMAPPSRHDEMATYPSPPPPPMHTLLLGSVHLPPRDLHRLFRMRPGVTILEIGIPGEEEIGLCADIWDEEPRMRDAMSPQGVVAALTPIKETLTSLTIKDGPPITRWPSRDSSTMDLRKFGALKYLTAPSECLFASDSETWVRKGVWEVLPPSIVALKITFGPTQYLLYPDQPLEHPQFNRGTLRLARSDPSRYLWLNELAEHKAAQFPGLDKVEIRERWNATLDDWECDICLPGGFGAWQAETGVEEVFAEAGLRMTYMVEFWGYRWEE